MGVFSRRQSPWWHLYLETTRTKEKTKIKIGTTTAQRRDSRRLAEDLYHRRMNQLAIDVHELPVARPPILFSDFVDWYAAHVSAHHRGHEREAEIVKGLQATFGPHLLTEIDRAAVLEWRTARAAAASASTANRDMDVLKSIFKAAVPKYLAVSPIAGLKRLRAPRQETRVLSRAEERRLLRQLTKADRTLVICALDTLMRLSDVVNLRRDQDRRTYLLVIDPKVEPYRVPVSARLRKALDALPVQGPYYFAHRRRAKKARDFRSGIKQMLERACEAANIPYGRKVGGLTFHGLRHTAATRLAEQGVSLRLIQELGGWKSLRQLERYAHPSEPAKQAAVEAIGSQPTRSRKRKRAKHSEKTRRSA
jgi:integrase